MGWVYPPLLLKGLAFLVVPPDQMAAFTAIISRESSWNVFAVNPSSGAYGLAQALPAEKMSAEGVDWFFNPLTQLRWAYKYMNKRYGSPNAAWDFWQQHHWY
ncbi:MAG: transglycosylase SLT domain-containing protein [Mycobacteriaceae bacterium]|nr:transglycosylase SLT domain-containing protein [Mycobacteriaceae bacterium]